jgi:polyferredoxin
MPEQRIAIQPPPEMDLPSPSPLSGRIAGRTAGRIAAFGLFLQRHRKPILIMQWLIVGFYALLVIVPAFMPLPPQGAHLWDNLRLFAQFMFWGVWWPGVMLATLTLGRVWCGLFCPEGTLTEWVSHKGLGKPVPRWLKWSGWPFVAFVCTTVYGQLVSVYEYPQAALLVLGGSSVAAVAVGLIYGRGKRIWCRYLCPASGVFAILAKVAPFHYRVDRNAWDEDEAGKTGRRTIAIQPVNCAPLVDIRRMSSASECHACGRCAGHHDAIQLAPRLPAAEIVDLQSKTTTAEAITLLFGILGVASAAFQWTVSPWFLQVKLQIAEWLVERDAFTLLQDNAPWWLLTHYPEANDVFTWLDGALVLAYILGGGFLLGALLAIGPLLAAAILRDKRLPWQRLTMALAPLAGISVFLGLSMLTLTHLKAEHLPLGWVGEVRLALLVLGVGSALWLSLRLVLQAQAGWLRRVLAFLALALPAAIMFKVWHTVFFVW